MPKDFWVSCVTCGHSWIAQCSVEFGLVFFSGEEEDGCIECGGEVELGDEYHG